MPFRKPIHPASGTSYTSSQDTAKLLETWSLELVTYTSVRDWSQLLGYLAPTFTDDRELQSGRFTRFSGAEASIALMRMLGDADPTAELTPYNSCVDLDDANGLATVWVTVLTKRRPFAQLRESVSMFKWRRNNVDGVWKCFKHTGISTVPKVPL